ncbi:Rho termination factor N-terminal domain-containing protein [Paractinoplanes maris]|uniref:Rho termination factor N-terminal domain-containing protein n=1 Tax=Paractinoplanes maris TaxID=1734446 RepID=UPI002021B8AD|nr:Rho termination factor N-terminal domain-containing protein [Actinoplanes maris]
MTSNELDADERNALPDSTFAFPRVRKEPLNDARHVRNAIARFDQVRDVSDQERDEAFTRIKRAAKKFGVEITESSWKELGKPSAARRSSDKPRPQAPKKDLYAEAQRRKVPGRSTMTKQQLIEALRHQ